jgi:hypothetical protein
MDLAAATTFLAAESRLLGLTIFAAPALVPLFERNVRSVHSNCCNQAITLKTRVTASMSVIAIFRQQPRGRVLHALWVHPYRDHHNGLSNAS